MIKRRDLYGNVFYTSAFTGKKVKLKRRTGTYQNKIPNDVYGRFIIPQQRGNNRIYNKLK